MKKILNLKPHPSYKPSGVEWLGDVPAHWEVRKLKTLSTRVQNGSTPSTEEPGYYAKDGLPWYSPPSLDRSIVVGHPTRYLSDRAVEEGKVRPITPPALAVSVIGNVGKCALMLQPGATNQQITCFELITNLCNPHFVIMQFRFAEESLIASASSATIAILDSGVLKATKLAIPPLSEQTAIVRYLDQVDERIRRYINSRERLIELLEEYRQVVIHHAVTHGLDTDVRLKSSGVEWLGDVPAHWEMRRVKQVSRILRGKFTHRPRNDPSLYNGPYPFIQTGDVARAKKTITEYSQTLNKQGLAVSKMFPTGTLVMTIAANIGDVAILDFEACFPDSVVGFVPHQNVDRDYLYYFFRAMKAEFLREAPVNTQGNLNVERIGARHIALPPISEQTAIVAYIDKATAAIDADIDRARREIELLGEYRTRLIADVVTGKEDVREAAAEFSD